LIGQHVHGSGIYTPASAIGMERTSPQTSPSHGTMIF
jgi:hypothetical protein